MHFQKRWISKVTSDFAQKLWLLSARGSNEFNGHVYSDNDNWSSRTRTDGWSSVDNYDCSCVRATLNTGIFSTAHHSGCGGWWPPHTPAAFCTSRVCLMYFLPSMPVHGTAIIQLLLAHGSQRTHKIPFKSRINESWERIAIFIIYIHLVTNTRTSSISYQT